MTKNTIKRYVWSTIITFLAGMGLVLVVEIDSITLDSFKDGTIVGVLFTSVRTGVKMVIELFLSWYSNR